MTAAELIALLAEVPPDTRVLVEGYEGDYDDPVVRGAVAELDTNLGSRGGYFGRHEARYPDDALLVSAVACLLLSRQSAESHLDGFDYRSHADALDHIERSANVRRLQAQAGEEAGT